MNKWAAEDLFGPLRSSLPEEQKAYEKMIKELSSPDFNIWNSEDKNMDMSDAEVGYCDICHKKMNLNRKYYYYGLECQCCGSKYGHFEIIKYCNNCTPEPPKWITVDMQPIHESD